MDSDGAEWVDITYIGDSIRVEMNVNASGGSMYRSRARGPEHLPIPTLRNKFDELIVEPEWSYHREDPRS